MTFWQLFSPNPDLAVRLASRLNVDPMIAQLLLNRNIRSLDDAREYMEGSDPVLFPREDVVPIWECMCQFVQQKKKIYVFGDYDVDGMTSTTMMMELLDKVGADAHFQLPDRFKDGYGLTEAILPILRQKKVDLLITLDCGITNTDIIQSIVDDGIAVIIIDHHTIPDIPPPATHILNPKAYDATDPNYMLCTAGIVYKFIEALERYQLLDIESQSFLDYAALGTVADIVPLNQSNRWIVKNGLIQMTKSKRKGLHALLNVSKLNGKVLTPRDVGFMLAPRLNASGRLAQATIGVDLLSASEYERAEFLAEKLQELNTKRQLIGQEMVDDANKMLDGALGVQGAGVVAAGYLWHEGVIGITAAKLAEKWQKPAVVISYNDDRGKGSARTYGKANLYRILAQCSDLFTKFGGHKEAAGFTIPTEHIDAFTKRFQMLCQTDISEEERKRSALIDATLGFDYLSLSFVKELNRLEPFGQGNQQPIFLLENFQIVETRKVGNGSHVKLTICDASRQKVVEGIGFNLAKKVESTHCIEKIVFHLEKNEWNGNVFPQLNILDVY